MVLGEWAVSKSYLSQSLAAPSDTAESAIALQVLSTIETEQGNHARSKEHMHQSLAISRRIGDHHQAASTLTRWAYAVISYGDFAQARTYAQEAVNICRVLDRPDLLAHALIVLAFSLNCLGEYRQAEAYWRESLTLCQEVDNELMAALARNWLGWAAWSIGGERLAEAQHYYEQALCVYRKAGDQQKITMCLGDLAHALNEMGLHEPALIASQEGLAIAEAMGNPMFISYNLPGLGYATARLGDWDKGRRRLHQAMRITLDTELGHQLSLALYHDLWLLVDAPVPMQPAQGVLALTAFDLLIDHPKTWQLVRDRSLRLRAQLVSALPPEVVAAHAAQEAKPTLEALVAQIVGGETGVDSGSNVPGTGRLMVG